MDNLRTTLHSRIHLWMSKVGFRLNSSVRVNNTSPLVNHYFFKTFNFIELFNNRVEDKPEFVGFDTYGEKIKIRSLLDLQTAFFENLSQA